MRPPAPSPDQIVRKSVTLARADRAGHVSVAGPEGLAAMISLCRAGFDHVECARQATCPSADEVSDVLVIAGPMDRQVLAETVSRTCRLLRDHGVLVAQLGQPSDDAVVRAALEARGLAVTSTVFDASAGCLVSHTVARAAQALRRAG